MLSHVLETIIARLTGPDAWLYLAIPVTTGIIGWVTNIVALRMTFYPLEFIGIEPYLGWQGILPRKAVKIARQFSDLLTENLLSVTSLFDQIDPENVAREMNPAFEDLIEPTLRDAIADHSPSLWTVLPDRARGLMAKYLDAQLPELLKNLPDEEHDLLEEPNPEAVRKAIEEHDRPLEDLLDDMLHDRSPDLWESLPNEMRNRVILAVREDLPRIISGVIDDMKEDIDEIFNLKDMTVKQVEQNREILNEVFQESGKDELTFIERSGLYFGSLFGLVQMVLWMFYQPWWLLPAVGFFVGLATNYIAIQLIFSPKNPVNLGLFKLQGLAYKRRAEINEIFSRITRNRILNVQNILGYMTKGPGKPRVFNILQKHVHVAMDKLGGPFNPLINRAIGTERYFELKNNLARELMAVLPEAMEYSMDYLETELSLEVVLRENLDALPPEDYETVMRTPYKEDEWILILVGGVLGFTAGILQLIYLFGGHLPML